MSSFDSETLARHALLDIPIAFTIAATANPRTSATAEGLSPPPHGSVHSPFIPHSQVAQLELELVHGRLDVLFIHKTSTLAPVVLLSPVVY